MVARLFSCSYFVASTSSQQCRVASFYSYTRVVSFYRSFFPIVRDFNQDCRVARLYSFFIHIISNKKCSVARLIFITTFTVGVSYKECIIELSGSIPLLLF